MLEPAARGVCYQMVWSDISSRTTYNKACNCVHRMSKFAKMEQYRYISLITRRPPQYCVNNGQVREP